MNTISSVNTLSNSKGISSLSLSIQKSFSSGTYDYYVFTTGTSFTSNNGGTVEFIIIGGGGAGAGNHAGGGGAGGVAYGSTTFVSGTTYTVTVGAGGTGGGGVYVINQYNAANNTVFTCDDKILLNSDNSTSVNSIIVNCYCEEKFL